MNRKNNFPVNVAITIDINYLQHACVMLQSLRYHNPQKINVYCIHYNLDSGSQQLLQNAFVTSNLHLTFISFGEVPTSTLPIKKNDHVTAAAFFRIWLPILLKELDEVLFLDSDMIINGNISYLFDLNIKGYPLAAVVDPAMLKDMKLRLGILETIDYFNSGVLKMNLKYFRENKLTEKLMEFIREHPDKCEFWDQDAFNAVLKGNFYRLGYEYNMQSSLFNNTLLRHESFTYVLGKPIIIHFTGAGDCKPWFYRNHHPLKKLYYFHLRSTPFKNYISPDTPNFLKWIKSIFIFLDTNISKRNRPSQCLRSIFLIP